MSRSLVLFLFLSVATIAPAQWQLTRADGNAKLQAKRDNLIAVDAWFDYNANSLRNELPIALWRGEYLDRDLRTRSQSNLRERNSVGYVFGTRITWVGGDSIEGHIGWRSLMSVAYHEQMGMRFTRDLYSISFFGNANYEGRRADLGPSKMERVRYQTVGFGMQHARSNSFARVDLVIGQSYDAADVKWAGMYTAIDGRALRTSIRGDYHRSDTMSSKLGQVNGFGLAVSGRWETLFKRRMKGARLSFEVEDFGFASWLSTSEHISKDSIINYEGIRVASILDLDNVIIGEAQLRDTFGLNASNGAFTTWLPFVLRSTLRAPVGEHWRGAAMLEQRNLPGYIPQLTFSGERTIKTNTDVGACLSMGGFGTLRMGAMVRHRISDRAQIELSSPHVPGFFLGSARGAGVVFAGSFVF
ncbi:MAG TPA: DUF5723 family protein [Flavobacteriales bacterium]|nr:DUF5723 family protein [Flavobacteriales bacterium]